jgi:hypothetical protein
MTLLQPTSRSEIRITSQALRAQRGNAYPKTDMVGPLSRSFRISIMAPPTAGLER